MEVVYVEEEETNGVTDFKVDTRGRGLQQLVNLCQKGIF
jgi:hypothetical protein